MTTPPQARFQDALAFTRSLGDLHLHVYGVSNIPDVVEYDLAMMHSETGNAMERAKKGETTTSILLVCTDGVWDNWKFDGIVQQALQPEFTKKALLASNSQAATEALMAANLQLARAHFGNQADNMTAVVCYLYL